MLEIMHKVCKHYDLKSKLFDFEKKTHKWIAIPQSNNEISHS